jgi:hypothetical protein
MSAETRETIDDEVRRIVGEQFARAEALLAARRDVLGRLAADLLQSESLDGSAVREALAKTSRPAAAGDSAAAVKPPDPVGAGSASGAGVLKPQP